MSLRSYFPWRVSTRHPYWMTLDDGMDDFMFSSLVPRWRRETTRDPFAEFEKMFGLRERNGQVDDLKVDNKKIGLASNEQNFAYNFDLTGFAPKDIKVKTVGQKVVVEAEHEENEEKDGCHSFCHRHYHRTVMLPKNVKPEDIKSKLSKGGVLSITAPILVLKEPEKEEREIAIEQEEATAEDATMCES